MNIGPGFPPRVVAAVIEHDGKVLIARRREGGIGGSWEFPGGKLREGEDPETGLERELAEELGVKTHAGKFLCSVLYHGSAFAIDLLAYRVTLVADTFTLVDHEELRWVAPARLDESMFSEPDRQVVRLLVAEAGMG